MNSNELKLHIIEGKAKQNKIFSLGKPPKNNSFSLNSLHSTPIKEKKNKLSLQFLKINEEINKLSRYKDSRDEISGFVKIFKPFNKNTIESAKKISHSPSIYSMLYETLKEKLENKKEDNPYYLNQPPDSVRRDYMNFNNKMIKTSIETFYSGRLTSPYIAKTKKFKDSSELDIHSDFNLTASSPFFKRTQNKIISLPVSPNNLSKISTSKNKKFTSAVIFPKFENFSHINSHANEKQSINDNNKEINLMFKRKKIFLEVPKLQINYKIPKLSLKTISMPSLCTIKSKN